MRFSKSNWNASSTMLATAALIVIAGVAGAIFDDDVYIDASEKFAGTSGYVHAAGDTFGTGAYMMCQNADNDFEFGCDSTHPDGINMNPVQGKVNQKRRDNNANAWIYGGIIGGIDEMDTTFFLNCERVQATGKANDKKGTADAKCVFTKCDLPEELTVGQIASIEDCIEESEDDGSLGKRVSTMRLDNNNKLKGTVRSSGDWD